MSAPATRRVAAWVAPFVVTPLALTALFERNPPVGIYLLGLVLGALYGLIAMGMVLVHRASRVVNFAQASIGAVPAALGISLYVLRGWPFWVAVACTLLGGPLLGMGVDRTIVRPFRGAPRLVLAVVLIGVGQVLAGFTAAMPTIVGGEFRPLNEVTTPLHRYAADIAGVRFNGNHLLAVVIVVLLAIGLAAFLRGTDTGVAVRAAADNGDRAALLGIPTARVSATVWAVAGLLSACGVFLRAPLVGLPLDGNLGPVILLYSLTAAVLARMERLPVALGAGMAIGLLDQGVTYALGRPNISQAMILPVLLIGLLLQREKLGRAADSGITTWRAVREQREIPPELRHLPEVVIGRRVVLGLVVALVLVIPLLVADTDLNRLTLCVVYAICAVSLVILTGWAGQVSLGQFAFVGIGAAVAGGLAADLHWDFFVCVTVGGLAGAAFAVVLGLPALRIQGLYLAVTTLAFATNLQSFFLDPRYFAWVLPAPSNVIERPQLWQRIDTTSDRTFFYVAAAGLVLAVLAARSMRRSRSGRVLIATRENPRAAQSYGLNLARTRLAAFALAGFLAAVAGGLLAYRSFAVDAGVFTPDRSIAVFTMAVIGGITSIGGAIAGAVLIVGIDELAGLTLAQRFLVTGVGVIVILRWFPGGLAEVGERARDAALRRIAARRGIEVPSLVADRSPHPDPIPSSDVPAAGALLSCRGVEVGYDKVQVLFGVDLDVQPAETVALLGTNGAGKSTLLRAVTGLAPPSAGTVVMAGADVTGASPGAMVAAGVVAMPGGHAVFPTLTVADNLRAATWTRRRDDRAAVEADVEAVLDRFPRLRERIDQPAGNLSGGEQQMLGLGMAFVLRPRLLLIDELSLGLAPAVVEELLGLVRGMQASGTSVVLVEQSVNVALTVADRAVFLEKGVVRFSGATADLLDRPDLLRSVFLEGARGGVADVARPPRGGPEPGPATPVLEVAGLVRGFGGIRAVDDVSFSLHDGEVLGIIGPNGAGKTTVFDLVSGFTAPDQGHVRLLGVDVTGWGPDARARAGLGRSFQDARIFSGLTVSENIAVACERHIAVRDHLAAALGLPAVAAAELDVAWTVDDLVELLGLGAYRSKLASELSTGTRRVIDLAMALAHDPRVLVLDEPTSGIAQRETEALGDVLRRVRVETGCAMLVIEHDMPFIAGVSDRMLALDLGRVIAEGSPADVLTHPDVVSSYLGTDAAAIGRSGVHAAVGA